MGVDLGRQRGTVPTNLMWGTAHAYATPKFRISEILSIIINVLIVTVINRYCISRQSTHVPMKLWLKKVIRNFGWKN